MFQQKPISLYIFFFFLIVLVITEEIHRDTTEVRVLTLNSYLKTYIIIAEKSKIIKIKDNFMLF